MQQIAVLVLAIMLVSSMTVPAYAYSGNSMEKNSWLGWFSWWGGFGSGDETEPAPVEPKLEAPTISEATFCHNAYVASMKNRLQIRWNEIEDVEGYEIEVTKADGSVEVFSPSSATQMLRNAQCPKVYVEETATWTVATVRVRAVSGSQVSGWSDAVKISCDKMH